MITIMKKILLTSGFAIALSFGLLIPLSNHQAQAATAETISIPDYDFNHQVQDDYNIPGFDDCRCITAPLPIDW